MDIMPFFNAVLVLGWLSLAGTVTASLGRKYRNHRADFGGIFLI